MKNRSKHPSFVRDFSGSKHTAYATELGFRNSLEGPRSTELQQSISALNEQNYRLQLENQFLKERQREFLSKELQLTATIKQLKTASAWTTSVPPQTQQKIDTNYAQLMQTVNNLQISLRDKFQHREDELRQTFEAKLHHKFEEARAQLTRKSEATLELQVKQLTQQVESLTSKLLYYEEVTDVLVRENKALMKKSSAANTELEALVAGIRSRAESKVASTRSSPAHRLSQRSHHRGNSLKSQWSVPQLKRVC